MTQNAFAVLCRQPLINTSNHPASAGLCKGLFSVQGSTAGTLSLLSLYGKPACQHRVVPVCLRDCGELEHTCLQAAHVVVHSVGVTPYRSPG